MRWRYFYILIFFFDLIFLVKEVINEEIEYYFDKNMLFRMETNMKWDQPNIIRIT